MGEVPDDLEQQLPLSTHRIGHRINHALDERGEFSFRSDFGATGDGGVESTIRLMEKSEQAIALKKPGNASDGEGLRGMNRVSGLCSRPIMRLSRRILFTLLPTALLVGGLLVVVEVALRELPIELSVADHSIDTNNAESVCSRSSLTRGWEPIPGTCGRDQHGFFGEERAEASADGDFRVLVVGDSIAANQRWVKRMATSLQEDNASIEVLNAGVSGYDTCQELRLLIEVGLAVSPDLVLLQTCPNDIGGSPVMAPLPDGRVRYFVGHQAFDFPAFVLHSRVLSYGVLRYGALRSARELAVNTEDSAAYTASCLDGIQDLTRHHDISLAAVLFPLLIPTGDAAGPHPSAHHDFEDRLGVMLDERQIPLMRLRPTLEADGDITQWQRSSEDVIHPRPAAQELIGPVLASWLQESGLVP